MRYATITSLALILLSAGCHRPDGASKVSSPLIAPLQGRWRLDREKTFARWEADRMPAAELAQARKLAQTFPPHPDVEITGSVAVLSGMPEGEYAFFGLHQHGTVVCGKAWHHEDRHDPGDMSKCYVRLERKDNELRFSVRHQDGSPELDDPDIENMPLHGSAADCAADTAKEPDWSPWITFVFVKD